MVHSRRTRSGRRSAGVRKISRTGRSNIARSRRHRIAESSRRRPARMPRSHGRRRMLESYSYWNAVESQ